MIHAIIPAAGRSSRMGQPKQLMDIAGRPMLLVVADPLIACGQVECTVVVTNSLVASALDINATGATVLLNDEPDAEMIDSVRLGIEELQHRCELNVDDGILICPGDQPGLSVGEIARCCAAFDDQPGRIIVATHDGKRGHPLIFPASRIPFLMSQACDKGLRELVTTHEDNLAVVEIHNSAVLRNVNTPDDFRHLSSP
jgi:molybdenum cofactor cytidylyltransferase